MGLVRRLAARESLSSDPASWQVLNNARVRVDCAALASNYRFFADRSEKACAAVVKANAYGMGVEYAVPVFERAGCRVFAVATVEEGIAVRALTAGARILLLGGVDQRSASVAEQHRLEPVLNHPGQAAAWHPYRHLPAVVHIDTGMERLGFTPAQLADVAWQDYRLSLVMTHLASADQPEDPLNALQLERFDRARATLPALPVSIANSAGCLLPAAWHGDLTRPGIGLYGGHPQNRIEQNPLQPVVSFEARVVQIREISRGTGVGYGGTWQAPHDARIAVLGAGYADGLPRLLGNRGQASFAGRRVPIVGRLSMDMLHLDVTALGPEAPRLGDWVQLLGADIGVDEVAQWSQTIGLEILCDLGRRPVWRYERFEGPG